MNTRNFTLAAAIALASLGAQAGQFITNVPEDFVAAAHSTASRADVQAQAAQAIAQGEFKNYTVGTAAPVAASQVSREQVRQDAAVAVRTGHIAAGDLS